MNAVERLTIQMAVRVVAMAEEQVLVPVLLWIPQPAVRILELVMHMLRICGGPAGTTPTHRANGSPGVDDLVALDQLLIGVQEFMRVAELVADLDRAVLATDEYNRAIHRGVHRRVLQIDAGLASDVVEVGAPVRTLVPLFAIVAGDVGRVASLRRQDDVDDVLV